LGFVPGLFLRYESLVEHKGENTYINIPKLKSHGQCKVTICIKNQHGLLYDKEKVYNHHLIDDKIVDILSVFRPDFCIVDATTVINFGPTLIDDQFKLPMGILFAGTDPVAVDTVGSKLVGIENVKHIEMAAERGLGTNNIEEINVLPSIDLIDRYKIQLEHDPNKIPLEPNENITIFKGAEQACKGGCGAFVVLGYGQRLREGLKMKPFALVIGKGHDTNELDTYQGQFIINGPCAIAELKSYFDERKKNEKMKVFYIEDHCNVAEVYKTYLKAAKLTMADIATEHLITPERWMELTKTCIQNGGNFISIL